MVECVVCRYWSERLEEARRRRRGNGPLNEENRVIGALRKHQCGACACKHPHLLKHLVKGEPWLPFKTPNFCDPVRIRIIAQFARLIRTDARPASGSNRAAQQFREWALLGRRRRRWLGPIAEEEFDFRGHE